LHAQLASNPSQIWRSIIKGTGVLSQGLIRRVGDGKTIDIWEQIWLPRDSSMRPYACLAHERQHSVSELIDETTSSWNKSKIPQTFLPIEAETIPNIPLSIVHQEDFWAWGREKRGVFSVKSAYRMLVTTKMQRGAWLKGHGGLSNPVREQKPWTKLSRVDVPSKLKVFLWHLEHQSIPTADQHLSNWRGLRLLVAFPHSVHVY
jgi:hypothetical protein